MIQVIIKFWFSIITIACLTLTAHAEYICVNKSLNNCESGHHSSIEHEDRHINTKLYKYYLTENFKDDVHKVVIDAGHGGHDPGCHGAHSKEKDIALQIALKTGKELKKSRPDIEIIYTRTTDIFIPLHKRIALANDKKADIFISIHCNYVGNPKICGTETYVMGLHRAEENLKVAKRENSVVLLEEDFESNYEGYDPNSPVGHIVLSMFQNLHLDQSITLAADIEDRLSSRKYHKSRGVKQAGFAVLRQATMPSILVETGFLSNRKEEKYLMSKAGQAEMSKSLSNSLSDYFKVTATNTTPPKKTSKQTSIVKEIYTIQIGVYSENNKHLIIDKKLSKEIKITSVGEVFRYTLGAYGDKETALATLSKIHDQGLTDAYIKKIN